MFFIIPLLAIIFNAFYHVDCEGEASSIANSSWWRSNERPKHVFQK